MKFSIVKSIWWYGLHDLHFCAADITFPSSTYNIVIEQKMTRRNTKILMCIYYVGT